MSEGASQPEPVRLPFMPTAATFRLGEPLGSGTVGTVYRAESDDVDCPVAVKLLHPHIADDAGIVQRFHREIVVMQRLQHPHIVRHFGGGIMDGRYFYAMELLDQGSLKDLLKARRGLPWPLAALYAEQVASALQHAHNHGVIHRDLKPSNLFFRRDGSVVLGDFGIARDLHDQDVSDHGVAVGTYAYMSPEQICADRDLTGRSDLYSLGCVMYEMLAGVPPFTGANFAQIWDQHLHNRPTPLSQRGVDCPEWLDELTMQLLEKSPEKRPFNARSVQGVLREKLLETYGKDYAGAIRRQCVPA